MTARFTSERQGGPRRGRRAPLWLVATLALGAFGISHGEGATQQETFADAVTFCRHTNGWWQVWLLPAGGGTPRQVTRTPLDKRSLRWDAQQRRILFRDSEGKLHGTGINPGSVPRPITCPIPQVKDFDYTPSAGYLISAYAPNAKDNIWIWRFRPSESSHRAVVADAHLHELPRWIPGRNAFVFVSTAEGRSRLALFDGAAGKRSQLAFTPDGEASEPAVSPAGSALAFTAKGKEGIDLWLAEDMHAENAKIIYAGPGMESEPCWSSDGEWIVFTTWDGRNLRLARIDRDGNNFTYLTEAGSDCRFPLCISRKELQP